MLSLISSSLKVKLAAWSVDSVGIENEGRFGEDTCGSNLDFWLQYLLFITVDIKDRHRIGLAIHCCQSFFEHHSKCSIPQMRYLFACTLAECFESLGDAHS